MDKTEWLHYVFFLLSNPLTRKHLVNAAFIN
jgi:hypothetical protein